MPSDVNWGIDNRSSNSVVIGELSLAGHATADKADRAASEARCRDQLLLTRSSAVVRCLGLAVTSALAFVLLLCC